LEKSILRVVAGKAQAAIFVEGVSQKLQQDCGFAAVASNWWRVTSGADFGFWVNF